MIWLTLCLGPGFAQSPAKAVGPAKAAAVLAGQSIRVHLPLPEAARTGAAAVAWLLTPSGERLAEIRQTVRAGAAAAELELAYPQDKKAQPVESVQWYRLGYRFEAGGQILAQATVSLGEITSNLLQLTASWPKQALEPGKSYAIRVYAGHPVRQEPAHGVAISAKLLWSDEQEGGQTVVRTGVTDRAGEAVLRFTVPRTADSRLTTAGLTITATARGAYGELATSTLRGDAGPDGRGQVQTELDKPLYQPGQTAHLRVRVLDAAGKPAVKAVLKLTVDDDSGQEVAAAQRETDRFGVAAWEWKLEPGLGLGEYRLKVSYQGLHKEGEEELVADDVPYSDGYAAIRVARYELPEFTVSAALDHGYYLSGQRPEVTVRARFLFGQPVAGGLVRLVRQDERIWNPKTRQYEEREGVGEQGVLDAQGVARFHPDLSADFADLDDDDYSRYRDVSFQAFVTDPATGRTEPRKFDVRVTLEPIHIYLHEVGSDERAAEMLLTTTYADGTPAACKVTVQRLDEQDVATGPAQTLETNRYGLARLHLEHPRGWKPSEELHLKLTARDSHGLEGKHADELHLYRTSGWIDLEKHLLKPGEEIKAVVHGPKGAVADVDLLGVEGTLAHERLTLTNGQAALTLPADARFHGLVTLAAYSIRDEAQRSYGSNVMTAQALYPEDKTLRLKLTGLPKSGQPGDEVAGRLHLTDASGNGVLAEMGVAVTDQAVDERARTQEDFEEGWGGWSGYSAQSQQSGGITLDDLNRLKLTEPLPEGIDLVAQDLLSAYEPVQIQSNADQHTRGEFSARMAAQLAPLGKALTEAGIERLTADRATIERLAGEAKVQLADAWGTPFRAQAEVVTGVDVLSLVSAGPDQRFGSPDDFVLPVARQSVFAHPGRQLDALLRKAAEAGEPLPGTPERLLEFALAGGLDLAALRDPAGRPFVYFVALDRNLLSVSVSLKSQQTNNELQYWNAIWRSSQCDYFAPFEARLTAALNGWMAAGHGFPANQPEIDAMLAAAGLKGEAVLDPAGLPYRFLSRELMTYTRAQKVTGGATLQVQSKPVTQHLHGLQVLRTPAPGQTLVEAAVVVGQIVRPYSEQSGQDLDSHAVAGMNFRGDTGAIGGTVTDASGAVIPGAKIVVTSETQVKEVEAESSDSGQFLIGDLEPGLYRVRLAASGFKFTEVRGVQVSSAAVTTVDLTLEVGSAAETVEVTSSSPLLQTESGSIASAGGGGADKRALTAGKGTAASKPGAAPQFTPRLRHNFDETAYWQPMLLSDGAGWAAFRFKLPDSLTTWNVRAVASTLDGRQQRIARGLTSFQPLMADVDAPQLLTVGDEIALPVILRNYAAHVVSLPVTLAAADWFQPLSSATVRATAPVGGTAKVGFNLRATGIADQGALRVTAANSREGDAVQKPVRVHPDGEPVQTNAAGLLGAGQTRLQLDVPAEAIAGVLSGQLRIAPNLGTRIAASMQALLRKPHGCAEQTISAAYPALLLLQLIDSGSAHAAHQGEARQALRQGTEHLGEYFAGDGALSYWGGGSHGDVALTAYGMEFLLDAAPVTTVQPARVAAARRWLLDQQQPDGGWSTRSDERTVREALYAALVLDRSLAAGGEAPELARTRQAVERAVAWAANSATAVHDPYANALRLLLAVQQKNPVEQQRLAAELLDEATDDSAGAFWTSTSALPFYSWGRAGAVESTALVVRALERVNLSDQQRQRVDRALVGLLSHSDFDGLWYSGQTTTQVLRALLPYAAAQRQAARTAHVTVNGTDLDDLHFDAQLEDAPRSVEIGKLLRPGTNQILIDSGADTGFSTAEAVAAAYIPWQQKTAPGTTTGKDYGLDFAVHCAAANATVGKPIDCTVTHRRFGQGGGMLLAEVGLPPGADIDREALAKLRAEGTIGRYELEPDRIRFYLCPNGAEPRSFHFRFKPRYTIRAKAAPSSLFDFYNPDERVVLAPQTFTVRASAKD